MKTAIACAIVVCLLGAPCVNLDIPCSNLITCHIVSDVEMMQRQLELYVLYNQEVALLQTLQNEGSR